MSSLALIKGIDNPPKNFCLIIYPHVIPNPHIHSSFMTDINMKRYSLEE